MDQLPDIKEMDKNFETKKEISKMETQKLYVLPELDYEYEALAPYISEELLRLHHDKHHTAYVKGANVILQNMDKARAKTLFLTRRRPLRNSHSISAVICFTRFFGRTLLRQGMAGAESQLVQSRQ